MNEVCVSWSCEVVIGKSSGSIAILGPKESSAFAICVGLDHVLRQLWGGTPFCKDVVRDFFTEDGCFEAEETIRWSGH